MVDFLSEEEIKALLKEKKKDELLSYVKNQGTVDVTQAARFLKSENESKEILLELENEGYVENTNADFYHITYEGEKRSRKSNKRKIK